ncbi:hypothetical protein J6V85_02255, partial [Candidatus Saccharibacteria bacterium]|nr:hypothetical protein [Candidatus Saccharibacteria bacterium]
KTEDVVHSSAYAQAQNKKGIGVASTEGFAERMKIEQNRTTIRAYGDSRVVNDSFGQAPRPMVYNPETDKSERLKIRDRDSMAVGRAMMANKTAVPAPSKPTVPPARKNPGISR